MPIRDPMWRVIDGIERDIEHAISPWLIAQSTLPGDPPDRARTYLRRLLELVRERNPGPRS